MILRGQNVTKLNFDFVDVITIKRQDDKVGVAILMVRKSDLIDSRYYIQKSLEDNKDFLANFIVQYYTERSFIPKEIIIKESLTDTKSIEIILSERAQRKIKIKKIQKGDKNKLLKLAETNLKSHFAKDHANEEQRTALIERLKKKLHLQNLPKHIECYDVSNISGKFAVASLVTFTNAQKSSAHYRRFKIKTLETPNDYAMLKEVFKRRFSKKTSGWKKPDLIIVDGGKGQLKQIQAVFEEWSITDIDFVAIAKGTGEGARARGEWDNKKQEEIYLPNRTNPVILKPGTKELNLLQNIRDEAHRFAITYHRNLRDKALSQSFLDDIPGIGAKRKKELIKHFGSPERVVNASIEKLKEIKGLTPKIIKQLKALKISK